MNDRTSSGFTLIELLVVIAIIAIFATMLVTGLNAAMNRARQITCASNMREIGKAMTLYLTENQGRYPYASESWSSDSRVISWDDRLGMGYDGRNLTDEQAEGVGFDVRSNTELLVGAKIYVCPGATRKPGGVHPHQNYWSDRFHMRSYVMNNGGRFRIGGQLRPRGISGYKNRDSSMVDVPSYRVSQVPEPANTILLAEVVAETRRAGGRQAQLGNLGGDANNPYGQTNNFEVEPTHNGRFNYLFCDGHVRLLDPIATVGTGGPGPDERDAKGMWTRESGD